MSQIRAVYSSQPNFPATDQHPDAARYFVNPYWVDAIGGQPTLAEIQAMLGTDAAGQARTARREADLAEQQALKGNNALMTFVDMTPAQIDSWVAANVNNLAEAKDALAMLAKIVNVAIRRLVRD